MFDGSVNFAAEIERRVKQKNASYLDAVMDVCETFEIEPQSVAKHLTKPVIEKIKLEASQRNLIRGKEKQKYSGTRLPI
jgi:benzoyl-CoA reductase/2-hydroxyglutaryl-CoA dehydratase subunit BcrC/BadD/HgdB